MMKDTWDVALFAPFLRLINAALLRAKYVRSLVLRLPPDPHGTVLDRCDFRRLNHYGSCFDGVSDFLKRHPTIKDITILGEKSAVLLHPTHIPLLEVFSGPAHLVPNVVPGRPVHSVKLWWPLRPWQSRVADVPDSWYSKRVINCLAQSTFEDGIVRVENLFWDWPPRHTLYALATSLTLRFLFIRSRNYAESAYNTFLVEIAAALPQFEQLHELGVIFSPKLYGTDHKISKKSSIRWFRTPGGSATFWVPLHPNSNILAHVFAKTLWKKGLESTAAWKAFCQDTFALRAQLHQNSFLFVPIQSQVIVIQSLSELIPPLLE
ncbi:hypothetical protein C8R47DRAFT_1078042 [Mycena vitilis]|nr:hypothetical protein C8R47DRAFT_1078042 [Mycena vitilis]